MKCWTFSSTPAPASDSEEKPADARAKMILALPHWPSQRDRTTQQFRRQSAPSELLGWALAAASRAAPLDVTAAGTLLEHLVNVHDVKCR